MKEIFLSMLIFGVVVVALLNLYPKEVVREVVKEVPRVVVKETVVVKEVVKETPVIYETVNHYHYHNNNQNVVYYQQPVEPRIQRASYNYYEPVKKEEEVPREEITEQRPEVKPKVKMFLVEGIREPLWVEGGVK